MGMNNTTGHTDNLDDSRPTHLDKLGDGLGCTEVWEVLSKRRAARRERANPSSDPE